MLGPVSDMVGIMSGFFSQYIQKLIVFFQVLKIILSFFQLCCPVSSFCGMNTFFQSSVGITIGIDKSNGSEFTLPCERGRMRNHLRVYSGDILIDRTT